MGSGVSKGAPASQVRENPKSLYRVNSARQQTDQSSQQGLSIQITPSRRQHKHERTTQQQTGQEMVQHQPYTTRQFELPNQQFLTGQPTYQQFQMGHQPHQQLQRGQVTYFHCPSCQQTGQYYSVGQSPNLQFQTGPQTTQPLQRGQTYNPQMQSCPQTYQYHQTCQTSNLQFNTVPQTTQLLQTEQAQNQQKLPCPQTPQHSHMGQTKNLEFQTIPQTTQPLQTELAQYPSMPYMQTSDHSNRQCYLTTSCPCMFRPEHAQMSYVVSPQTPKPVHEEYEEKELKFKSSQEKKCLLRHTKGNVEKIGVTVEDGSDDLCFLVSGQKKQVEKAIECLLDHSKAMTTKSWRAKQPGLKRFSESGELDKKTTEVGSRKECLISVEKHFQSVSKTGRENEGQYAPFSASAITPTTIVTTPQGHKITWKTGDITKEKAQILVIPQGTCFDKIRRHFNPGTCRAIDEMQFGEITISSGNSMPSKCISVIHCCCYVWDGPGGRAERNLRTIVENSLYESGKLGGDSIAFPILGTGSLKFPAKEACRIMLEEAVNSCRKQPQFIVKDIRFIIFDKDKNLIDAFKLEASMIHKQGTLTAESFPRNFERSEPKLSGDIQVEIIQGDLTKEKTEAIVNIMNSSMDMQTAGQLSKAIANASGKRVQDECSQLGRQNAGAAVMTSAGNLGVSHIIHIVPGSSKMVHLQHCLENALRLADRSSLRSISIPSIGTGHYKMSGVHSAQLTFNALRTLRGSLSSLTKVRIVVYQVGMVNDFEMENRKFSNPSNRSQPLSAEGRRGFNVDIINGDLTREKTAAIVNINSQTMEMHNSGQLGKALAKACGPKVQRECGILGAQRPGSAVMTSGGNLRVGHIIHIVPGSKDKGHLRECLEEGLRLADQNNLPSVSIPAIGSGNYKLSATESAKVIFEALKNFNQTCVNITDVRVVVYCSDMMQAFYQEKALMYEDCASLNSPADFPTVFSQFSESFVEFKVTGKESNVDKAVAELKTILANFCITKLSSDKQNIAQLSQRQINILFREAFEQDIDIEFDLNTNSVKLRGSQENVAIMASKITDQIKISEEKQKEEGRYLEAFSNLVEWAYQTQENRTVKFDKKANAELELAWTLKQQTVEVQLNGNPCTVALETMIGKFPGSQPHVKIQRELKEGATEIVLPSCWTHMSPSVNVDCVILSPRSSEYQDVQGKFQETVKNGVKIINIERIQNAALFKAYMLRKQKMDRDNGENSERRLFHATSSQETCKQINVNGFNRGFCGKNGVWYGRGVYFARDARYSLSYTGRNGRGFMYLARVLVGKYCKGNSKMITPPPRGSNDPTNLFDSVVDNEMNPGQFVVFYDDRCYPEYLIHF